MACYFRTKKKSGEEDLKIEKVRTFSNGWCMWALGVRFSRFGKGLWYLNQNKRNGKDGRINLRINLYHVYLS